MNYEDLNESETIPEEDYDNLEDDSYVIPDDTVESGIEITPECPTIGIPRRVNPFEPRFIGDISSISDHSSYTNVPFNCANSETGSDISCVRHVRSSNSSDSSYTGCADYKNGFACVNSISSGSDNRDHYTDARSSQTVLRDDVRYTNCHGNTARNNNRPYQYTELLDNDKYSNCDFDVPVSRLPFSDNGHSNDGSSNDSLHPASSSYCTWNNNQNDHENRQLENNETHTLISTSENEITGTNIHRGAPLTDGCSEKLQNQPNNAKHRSLPHHDTTNATIANKETESMNDDDYSSGNDSQTSSTYCITSAQSSSLLNDEKLPSRCIQRFEQDRVLQHSSNRTSQIVRDAPIRPIHSPISDEGIDLYHDFESTNNDILFSPPSTEQDDYLTCVYDV